MHEWSASVTWAGGKWCREAAGGRRPGSKNGWRQIAISHCQRQRSNVATECSSVARWVGQGAGGQAGPVFSAETPCCAADALSMAAAWIDVLASNLSSELACRCGPVRACRGSLHQRPPPWARTPSMARHGGTGLLQASAMSIIASVPSMNSNSTPACSFSQLCRCATSSGVHTQLEVDSAAAAAAQHLRREWQRGGATRGWIDVTAAYSWAAGQHGLNSPVLASLQQEAALMAALRHPNCVQLLGVCTFPPAMATDALQFGVVGSFLRLENG